MAGDRQNSVARRAALVLPAQSANPIALGDVGLWWDGTHLYHVAANGTQTDLLAGGASVDFTSVNAALATANASINVNSQKITGLGTPTTGTDAVTKTYADGLTPAPPNASVTTAKLASDVAGATSKTSAAVGSRTAVTIARTIWVTSDASAGASGVSLPSGTTAGQRITFQFYSQAAGGDSVRIYPEATVGGTNLLEDTLYTTYLQMVNPHDHVEFEWTGSKWRVVSVGKTVNGS